MKELIPKEIEQLEAWWNKTLPEAERVQLERRIKEDSDFRIEAEQLRKTLNALYAFKREEWRKKLPQFNRSDFPLNPPLSIWNPWNWLALISSMLKLNRFVFLPPARQWLVLTATMLLLLFGGSLIMNQLQKSRPEYVMKQLGKEFNPPDWLPSYRGKAEQLLDEAAAAYKVPNYQRVRRKLEQYLNLRPQHIEARLMLIVAYLKLGKGAEAQPHIKIVEREKQFLTRIQWYKALAFTQQNQLEQALPLLEDLASRQNKWQTEAKAKLIELKRLSSKN